MRYTEGGGFATRARTISKKVLSTGEKMGFKPLIGRARDTIGHQFRQKNGVVNSIKSLLYIEQYHGTYSCPTELASNYLDKIMAPVVKSLPSHIKDS